MKQGEGIHPFAHPSSVSRIPRYTCGMVGPIKIFYSYSHADERMRATLGEHFAAMRDYEGLIVDWHDRRLPPGGEWDGIIKDELNGADIILLLLSRSFINSKYCREIEVKRAMERHEAGEAVVIPVFLRPCDTAGTPFGKLQGTPKDAKPVCNWRPQDNGFLDATKAVRRAAEALRDRRAAAGPAAAPKAPEPLILYQSAILAHPIGPVNADAEPLPPPSPAKVNIDRLPNAEGQLFGRDAMFEALDAAWGTGETGVAVLVAEGGTGKSVLVDRWLSGLRDRRWDGSQRVFGWSFYSQGSDRQGAADDFFVEALKFFGHQGEVPLSAWDRGLALAQLLRQGKGLLILDGLEPLQYGEEAIRGRLKDQGLQALLRTLARKGHQGLCLVTSRLPLSDLERHEGKGLTSITLGALSPDAGADLLQSRGITGTPAQLREVAQRFGGHALALSLLAVFLGFHDGDLTAAKSLRRHRPKGGNDDHARRVLDGLVPLLTPPQVAVLSMVGLFDRPAELDLLAVLRKPSIAGLEVAAAEWDIVVESLRGLRLLLAHDHAPVLDAHPVVRQYFGDRLKATEPQAWKQAHSRLFDALCSIPPNLPETLEQMAPLVQAMRHGVEAGRAQEALDEVLWRRICRPNTYYLTKQLAAWGLYLAALAPLFHRPWSQPLFGLDPANRSFVSSEAGLALRAVGRLAEALRPLSAGHLADKNARHWANAAISAGNLTEMQIIVGRLPQAMSAAEAAIAHADVSEKEFLRMTARVFRAEVLACLGYRKKALVAFAEAEAIQAKYAPAVSRLYSLAGYFYCALLLDEGNGREVTERATHSLKWVRPLGRCFDIALDTLSLGCAAHLDWKAGAGRQRFGAQKLDEAVAGLRTAGQATYLVPGLLARADFRLDVGDLDSAADDIDEAREVADVGGMRLYLADVLLAEGKLAIKRDEKAKARALLDEAASEIDDMGYHLRDRKLAELRGQLGA